jgi:imidazolonepropionase-like amidohydrolase
MIMKLADEFGIKAHTLIHNTEGYKIADKMRKHGAAGSIFSDWWAFKYEVYHAIPYNAALHLDQGVITCIHSDNAELSRRLNQEAAKAVKYGGVSEEEAWKLVTLNPARILHLDDRMGSIKPGKDADLVLWSDNPLSIYARAEKTMVDGIIYFDMDRDVKLQQYIQKERSRLLKKMIAAGNDKPSFNGARTNQQFLWDDEEVIDIFNETDINELNR